MSKKKRNQDKIKSLPFRYSQFLQEALDFENNAEYKQAAILYEKILAIDSSNSKIWAKLAIVSKHLGHLEKAKKAYEKAIHLDPKFTIALNNLGYIYEQECEYETAISFYEKVVAIDPSFVKVYLNISNIMKILGRNLDAIRFGEIGVKLAPNLSDAYLTLGNAYVNTSERATAAAFYEKALELDPNNLIVIRNYGYLYALLGNLQKAEELYRSFLARTNNPGSIYHDLAEVMLSQRKFEQAFSLYKQAYNADQGNSRVYGALLYMLNLLPGFSKELIRKMHFEFTKIAREIVGEPAVLSSIKLLLDRPLRVGYISPDFKNHSVAYFFEPLISAHNKSKVVTFCYSDVSEEDKVTDRIRSKADNWRKINGRSDKKVHELILQDNIDILVDLAGHTNNNRLLVFAMRAAPVQVSWLGYPNTTGLDQVDYRIVDEITDPRDYASIDCIETLLYIPDSFLCYRPPEYFPIIKEAPIIRNKYVTFGSFNNLKKVSDIVLLIWIDILRNVKDSRLIIKDRMFRDKSFRELFLKFFQDNHIENDRIILVEPLSDFEHLNLYNQVDIALDTFPYNGTTTSFEALFMGVPVVTFSGDRHASRVGASILTNIGVSELIAIDKDDYIKQSINLAKSTSRINEYRQVLRNKLLESTLCDNKKFAEKMENCYFDMWKKRSNVSVEFGRNS